VDVLDHELTMKIFRKIKAMSRKKMAEVMDLDGKLLDKTYHSYQDFHPETTPTMPAIRLYTGLVFDQLHLDTYDELQTAYLNDHLVILSAIYGLVHPQTPIWPYRLDMTVSIPGLKLKILWTSKITEALKEQDLIIDLSSQEFGVLLKPLGNKIHQVIFLENVNGIEKIISANAKKIRGKMADYLIRNRITKISELTQFHEDGYQYQSDRSSTNCSIFIKKSA